MKRIRTLLAGTAVGASLAYFFDPDRGKARRKKAADQFHAAGQSQLGDLPLQAWPFLAFAGDVKSHVRHRCQHQTGRRARIPAHWQTCAAYRDRPL